MGKPFATEIDALPVTYHWAIEQPIDVLARAIEKMCGDPLIALGSGGSFSASQFACHLHNVFTQQVATAMSPLQAATGDSSLVGTGILVPTARGNNPDVIGAVRELIFREPRNILVLCANPKSRIARLIARHSYVDLVEYEMPFGADGFLATNSLLGFSVLLARAYSTVLGQMFDLPKQLTDLLEDNRELSDSKWLDRRYAPLWQRQTLIVLHGSSVSAAAIDLESKFTEAALGNVQISDFRQFAHGRHHWLAKRANDTAVIALVSKSDRAIAKQTLALLPKDIPTCVLNLSGNGCTSDLSGLIRGFLLVGSAGRARGIDPGRPGVPPFGRKLYHANAFKHAAENPSHSRLRDRAIERKAQEGLTTLIGSSRLTLWKEAFANFVDRLSLARFRALVFDYDGTLCDENERFDPLPGEIAKPLAALLKSGIIIGVATGRGKSVRESLRQAFPKKLWKQINVGYYNGGEVLALNNESAPDGTEGVAPELALLRKTIDADAFISINSTITFRQRQITLTPKIGTSLNKLWTYCHHLVQRIEHTEVRALRSGHSIDILPGRISKVAVVSTVRKILEDDTSAPILCIGDRGCWPGNDFELLEGPFSLSVHEVSPDPDSCWNLSPPGQRGRNATLAYLRAMRVTRGGIQLRLSEVSRGRT